MLNFLLLRILAFIKQKGVNINANNMVLFYHLCRDIIRGSPDVKWESIKGLENAKRLLKEAVVMPIKYPK